MKFEFCHWTFEKYSDIKFHKHSYSGGQVFHEDGQMNMTKLKVTFHNFVMHLKIFMWRSWLKPLLSLSLSLFFGGGNLHSVDVDSQKYRPFLHVHSS